MIVKLTAIALLCISLIYVGSVSGKEDKGQIQSNKQYQIVFSTFDTSSASGYSYLRDSIQAMLASRLASRDKVNVLDRTFNEQELRSLKKKELQETLSIGGKTADYLVTGSLFSLTSGLEIQVDLYPLLPEKEVLHFSIISPKPDTLIADVEQLSLDIAQTAFSVQPDTPGNEVENADVGGNASFVTENPEEAYKKNLHSGTVVGIAGSGVTTKSRGPEMSLTMPVDMRAMVVGDITGDGDKEILILDGQDLKLFSKIENNLEQITETSLPKTIVCHAINIADLDGDGKVEIYVSATDGLSVSSMILEYDAAKGFHIVTSNIPIYLRPLVVPGKGWRLIGQKRGRERIDLVSPGIYLLSLDSENKIFYEERLLLPTFVNLFDFVYADLDGDGFPEVVVVDQKEKLRVYNRGNDLMWVSKKKFGSSNIYLGPSRGEAISERYNPRNFTSDEDAGREMIFVPGRIIATDIDDDGKEEIVISEAKETEVGFLKYFNRLRLYDSGAIVSLAWTGSTLIESWRTGNFRGYVAGYDFTLLEEWSEIENTPNDIVNKPIGRLFVGYLPKSNSLSELLSGSGKTKLIVYDLQSSEETVKKQ